MNSTTSELNASEDGGGGVGDSRSRGGGGADPLPIISTTTNESADTTTTTTTHRSIRGDQPNDIVEYVKPAKIHVKPLHAEDLLYESKRIASEAGKCGCWGLKCNY